ncbi:MAG TPA: fumarylacetoacetate hydrolase family protein [Baekduia sp.]|uniref:fumarylacetoacetate hydrolase family protein n=1 Tax=Baekduia sp. TaxID=2600305 RepID=UPI002D76A097|nr:fumarylacetoacetate hydrolase family protein [Baekduia sp.]HET6509876.1 fumarylacetoacetate hydrolase family protein [Baekduia sp.]
MRFATVDLDGTPCVVTIDDDGARTRVRGGTGRTLTDLLALPEPARAAALAPGEPAPADAPLLAPMRPSSIVCIGLNYLDHIREADMERPTTPLVFAKLRGTVIGPGETIAFARSVTRQVDWEVELAAVIGRPTRDVGVEDALDHVFGYTAANDVSARDVQFSDGQWVRGKSLDTFCPLGPTVVTADALGDPQAVRLSTRVNGEIVQDSSTSEMVFGVAELVSFCSKSFTLLPGDVLLTGTPWGCGAFADPPRFLEDGDVVEVEVEGIGVLRNPVVAT